MRAAASVAARLLLILVLLVGVEKPGFAQSSAPPSAVEKSAEQERLGVMAGVKSWGYQLRQLNFAELARSPFDLVVIDHALSAMKSFAKELDTEKITGLKIKPDGGRRVVLAYMSIGEAEVYRFYWHPEWLEPGKRPAWLAAENPQWPGNYNVRFWDLAWQKLIFGSPDAYLDRIIAAGFDGVYFDRADVFMEWAKSNPAAEGEMVRFILRMIAYARSLNPNFLVVMQNAEELLEYESLLKAIDGLAKEDLFYGVNHDMMPNDPDMVEWTIDMLRRLQRSGRSVLVVEYLEEFAKVVDARRRAEAERYVIHFAPRDLGELWVTPPDRRVQLPAEPPRP